MTPLPPLLASALTLALLFSPALQAQHETAFDLESGLQAYERLCANCHGPDGALIEGIDLGRGLYRRSYSDMELAEIILAGIPGTPMPPNPTMSEEQAIEIVSFLRSMPARNAGPAIAGDASRGQALYEGKGDCASCHRIDGQGSGLGPDLSDIGRRRSAAELQLALLDPDAEVQPANRFYRVTTQDGETVTGRLLNQDTFMVLLLDEQERLRAFDKAELREQQFVPPGMPSVQGQFSEQEVADLLAYLSSLTR